MEQKTINTAFNSVWNKQKDKICLISGILLLIYVLLQFISNAEWLKIISNLDDKSTLSSFLITHLTLALISISLFMKKKWMLVCSLSVYLIDELIAFFDMVNLVEFGGCYLLLLWSFYYIFILINLFLNEDSKLKNYNYVYVYIPVVLSLITLFGNLDLLSTDVAYYVNRANSKIFFNNALFRLLFGFSFAGIGALVSNPTESDKRNLRNIGFIGLIVQGVGIILSFLIIIVAYLIYGKVYFFDAYGHFSYLDVLWFLIVASFFINLALTPLIFCFEKKGKTKNTEYQANTQTETADGYIDLVKHILLSLFTFGIWGFIWIYRTTNYLNRESKCEKCNPTNQLLLCIFVPFYCVYWTYCQGEKLDNLAKAINNNYSDKSTLFLILGIFIPIVAYILMQSEINEIATKETTPKEEIKEPVATTEQSDSLDKNIEALKKLKDLLDQDILTQEEFEIKKKELLNL